MKKMKKHIRDYFYHCEKSPRSVVKIFGHQCWLSPCSQWPCTALITTLGLSFFTPEWKSLGRFYGPFQLCDSMSYKGILRNNNDLTFFIWVFIFFSCWGMYPGDSWVLCSVNLLMKISLSLFRRSTDMLIGSCSVLLRERFQVKYLELGLKYFFLIPAWGIYVKE